ncbi:FxSxx-COOH system tetratricopeptide repeat protein [Microbispora rosea]|uniref:FxSxx-COOH system tetratricopeptide repeat protein n=1 Tax=Microbispora rosea TaxID=58117 RepID=UPI0004C3D400|nr:FxSxx-COOH system tetratricopeptide repeat protein [Microbispora rosea]
MSSDAEGKIVTFYSYKGGTGRTMALANTAWILASNGLRVLVVDWDLDSPGLHKYFKPFLDAELVTVTAGVIDIVSDYMWAAVSPRDRRPDWHLDYARIVPHAVAVDWEFPHDGTLDFVSPGRQNRGYSSLVSTFDWDNFYERLGGGSFLDALRADMKRNYDYTLIDSRTGLSDVADICTIQMPDVVVDCFTLSDQSIEGAASVARSIDERYPSRGIRILPVPMRIDDGEKVKLDAGRQLARSRFDRFPQDLTFEEARRYWGAVEIPYRPFYAYEETLAAFGDAPGLPTSLLAAYERLTSMVTEGLVDSLPPMEEATRLRWLEAFDRRRPSAPARVLVSYAPEDRMWADWIGAVLEQAGCAVTPHVPGTPLPAHTGEGRALVVLSAAYLRTPQAGDVLSWLSSSRRFGDGHMVTVRVSDARPVPSDGVPSVDLVPLDAEQAAAAILRAFGRQDSPQLPGSSSRVTRFPGRVPPVWDVPPRDAAFTGRNVPMETLRDRLLGGDPVVLHGLGGVGKTQIALEYAHRFKADYDVVWWIPAEQPELITTALAELAVRLGVRVGDSVAGAAREAREALRRGEPYARWLLVFDNADDPLEVRDHLPGGPGHVIVTSRDQSWSAVATPLEVDVFTLEDSVEHLCRRVPGLGSGDARQVADVLGRLPLAVEQAAAWLAETGMAASDYIEQLRTRASDLLTADPPPGYPHPVTATWNVSLARLRERSPAAARLLQLCAFFSPEPISLSLLQGDEMIGSLLPHDSSLRGEKLMLHRLIRDITRFALAKAHPGGAAIQVNRLVQAMIKSQLTEGEAEKTRHVVHRVLVESLPGQGSVDDPENWPAYDLIWPHLLASEAEACTEEETRQLLIDRVRYLWKRGEFDNALQLGRRLADFWEATFGESDRQRLQLLFNIANVLRSRGAHREACLLDEWTWDQQSGILGDGHPHTLMTAGGLAADLRALGEYNRALEMDMRTYARWNELFGEDNPRTLSSADNLATSYRLAGIPHSALSLRQDVLDRRLVVLGPAHPYTLFSAAGLAGDMRAAGRFRDSAELLRRTLDDYRESLGEDFIDTLGAARSLAVSLRKEGRPHDARLIAQETYERLRRLHPSAPGTMEAALELACCMSALEEKAGARDMVRKIHDTCRSHLGERHPTTLVAANNLTICLRGTGELAEAYELGAGTLAALRDVVGDAHPFTLSCMLNVANCAADLGRPHEARGLEQEASEGLALRLGPEHPGTLAAQVNLAISAEAAGRAEEAERRMAATVSAMRRVLGDDHPDVAAALSWRRLDLDLEPQPT